MGRMPPIKETIMPTIGHATKQPDGSYKGELRTLAIHAALEILPNRAKPNEVRPDYRVLADGLEIGSGWLRRSESSGNIYVSLSIAAPVFGPRRLYLTLDQAKGQDDATFAIVWIPAD
jgi:uncharacterized protein (DUF736 family)